MKLLVLKAAYPDYVTAIYKARPALAQMDYRSQKDVFDRDASWAGAGNPWAEPMGSLGYEVEEILFNAEPLQRMWGKEHGIAVSKFWIGEIATRQVKSFKPDVLFIQDNLPELVSSWLYWIKKWCPSVKLIMGWRSAPPHNDEWLRVLGAYDVTLSCVPELVDLFRERGLKAHHLNHAFDQRVLSRIDLSSPKKRDLAVIGQIFLGKNYHNEREKLIRYLVKACSVELFCLKGKMYSRRERLAFEWERRIMLFGNLLKRWGVPAELVHQMPMFGPLEESNYIRPRLWHSSLDPYLRPTLYGMEMFQAVRDSRVVLNKHIDVAVSRPSNLRLYEVTGVGACLLTDAKEGMGSLFEPEREVVTYRSPQECLEKAQWLLAHPVEREEIAHRGQARCLRDHTYWQRAKDLDKIIRASLPRTAGAAVLPTVHVLIPTHNRVESLKKVLLSIRGQSYKAVKVHVITCGCTDGTSEMLAENFGDPEFLAELKTDKSVFWTEAMSMGVRKVLSACDERDFIFSFNDDLLLAEPETLSRLVSSQGRWGRVIVTSACCDREQNKYLSSGYRMDWAKAQRLDSSVLLCQIPPGASTEAIELDIVFGRGTLIPIRTFREIGNYNAKDFPHYGGDSELSHRAKEADWRCFLNRKAVVTTSFETSPGYGAFTRAVSFFSAVKVPFSHKSPWQLAKGFRFIDRCCPSQYRLKNKIAYVKASFHRSDRDARAALGAFFSKKREPKVPGVEASLKEIPISGNGKTNWPWVCSEPLFQSRASKRRRWPKITIVTPSFNQGKFLEQTIRSILLQGYPNLEYIIIDGGSTDNSVDIIKKYEPWLAYWVSEKDQGHGHALSKGFSRATGEIMAWLNSDDMYAPNALRKVADIFMTFKNVEWLTGLSAFWDEHDHFTGKHACYKDMHDFLNQDFDWIQQESTFWKRTLWKKTGGFINQEYRLMVDSELWCRFFSHAELMNVHEVLGGYRRHGGNRAQMFPRECRQETLKAIEMLRRKIPFRIFVLELYKKVLCLCRRNNLSETNILGRKNRYRKLVFFHGKWVKEVIASGIIKRRKKMNLATRFKIGVFVLTIAGSSFLAWLDFPAHVGGLAGLMVFLSGMMVLFCYELYSRACVYIGQKHWEQKDMLSAALKYLGFQNDLVSSTLKIVDVLQQQQKQLSQRAERISSSVVATVDLLTKLVEHVEESAGKEIRGVTVLLEVLQQQQKDVLEKVTLLQEGAVDGMLKPLEESMEKSSQKGLEAIVQLQKSFEMSAQKGLAAIAQLQKSYEISAKRDLEAKEKLVEIVSGLTD